MRLCQFGLCDIAPGALRVAHRNESSHRTCHGCASATRDRPWSLILPRSSTCFWKFAEAAGRLSRTRNPTVSIGLFDTLRFSAADEGITLSIHDAGVLSGSFGRDRQSCAACCGPHHRGNRLSAAASRLNSRSGSRSSPVWEAAQATRPRLSWDSTVSGNLGLDESRRCTGWPDKLGSDVSFFLDRSHWRFVPWPRRADQSPAAIGGGPLQLRIGRVPQSVSPQLAVFKGMADTPSAQGDAMPLHCWKRLDAGTHAGGRIWHLHNALQRGGEYLNSGVSVRHTRLSRFFRSSGVGRDGSGSACFGLCASRCKHQGLRVRCALWGELRAWQ